MFCIPIIWRSQINISCACVSPTTWKWVLSFFLVASSAFRNVNVVAYSPSHSVKGFISLSHYHGCRRVSFCQFSFVTVMQLLRKQICWLIKHAKVSFSAKGMCGTRSIGLHFLPEQGGRILSMLSGKAKYMHSTYTHTLYS